MESCRMLLPGGAEGLGAAGGWGGRRVPLLHLQWVRAGRWPECLVPVRTAEGSGDRTRVVREGERSRADGRCRGHRTSLRTGVGDRVQDAS